MDAAGRELDGGIEAGAAEVIRCYEACEYAAGLRAIKSHADALNRYFDQEKPWERIKAEPERARVALTTTLNGVRLLAAYLGPVLPRYAEKVGRLLGTATPTFLNLTERVEDRAIGAYERIAERLDPAALEAVIEETKAEQAARPQ